MMGCCLIAHPSDSIGHKRRSCYGYKNLTSSSQSAGPIAHSQSQSSILKASRSIVCRGMIPSRIMFLNHISAFLLRHIALLTRSAPNQASQPVPSFNLSNQAPQFVDYRVFSKKILHRVAIHHWKAKNLLLNVTWR